MASAALAIALVVACGRARADEPGGLAEPAAASEPADRAAIEASAAAAAAPGAAAAPVKAPDRPWARGVTPDKQERALKLLEEGNTLLRESLFLAAARRYREALADWDHPGIHYNLALALLSLDQPVEVYQNFQSAVQFGIGPLDADKLEHAHSFLRLLEQQVATLDLRCDAVGADVVLDGQHVFVAPGRFHSLLRAGPHTITASKPGFTTSVRTESLAAGAPTVINLRLYTAGELIDYRRRFPLWRPVAVTVLGSALLAAGAVMTLEARNRFASYDDQIAARCSASSGCAASDSGLPAIVAVKNQGDTFQRLATVAYVAGGVTAAAGALLLIIDRSTPFRVDPNGDVRGVAAAPLPLAPIVGPSMAGLVGTGRF